MRRDYLANTVLATLISLTCWALWSLGEGRVDAYLALYTLEYLVVKALFRPRRIGPDVLLLTLLAAFFIIVAYRILEVLGP